MSGKGRDSGVARGDMLEHATHQCGLGYRPVSECGLVTSRSWDAKRWTVPCIPGLLSSLLISAIINKTLLSST